jgi:hypothetical protein
MPTTSAARIKLQDATVRPSTAGRYHSFMRFGVAYPQRQSQSHHRARRGAASASHLPVSSTAINASAESSLSLAWGSDTSISIYSVAAAAGQRKPGITLTANKLAWNSVHEGANRWPPIALMSID